MRLLRKNIKTEATHLEAFEMFTIESRSILRKEKIQETINIDGEKSAEEQAHQKKNHIQEYN